MTHAAKQKQMKQMTNNVENWHLIKFNEISALLYRRGWDRIKLITIVSGVRDTRVNVLR